jgi:hypothetical protein
VEELACDSGKYYLTIKWQVLLQTGHCFYGDMTKEAIFNRRTLFY